MAKKFVAELIAIAEQEQVHVLQALIYDDSLLKKTMDINHRFKGAQALVKSLTHAASQQQALVSKDAENAQADFIEQIDPAAKGKYAGAVGGQESVRAKVGSRALDASKPVERFASPIILMDSAASINWATPASTVIYAGQQLHWTTQSDLHFASAHTMSSVAANAANLFTHSGGIQAIAGNGPVSLQAHTGQLEILADQAITVISVNDRIEIKAKEKIVLQAGQSSITLQGGDITFACPGKFTVKGGTHSLDRGAKSVTRNASLPDTRLKTFDQQVRAINQVTSEPLPDVPYRLETAEGEVYFGTTDDDGKTVRVTTISEQNIKIWWGVLPPSSEEAT